MKVYSDKTPYGRFAQVKRDGHSTFIVKDANGRVTYWSRLWNQLDLSFLPVHEELCRSLRVETQLEAELWFPGKPASYVKTGIKRQDAEARLDVFGCTKGYNDFFNQKPGMFELRVEAEALGLGFPPFYDRFHQNPARRWDTFEELWERINGAYDVDVEGFVMKRDARNDGAVKWKPFKDCTLRIVGYEEAKPGKFQGLIGSILCATENGKVVANASGMDDATRKAISRHREAHLGSLVEIKYQKVDSKGRLRHPNFVRFRDDKERADDDVE